MSAFGLNYCYECFWSVRWKTIFEYIEQYIEEVGDTFKIQLWFRFRFRKVHYEPLNSN